MRNWFAEPYEFVLWTYFQLQELDRRREWVQRLQRWELAFYIGKAFNQPADLTEIRAAILAAATAASLESDVDRLERGRALAAAFALARPVEVS